MSIAVLATPAQAAVDSLFELDGDVLDNGTTGSDVPDWGAPQSNSIFEMTADLQAPPENRDPLPANFFDAGFSRDFIPGSTADNSSFAGGGSKDIYDVSSWKCKTVSNQTDKGDIQNAYAAVATDPSNQHLLLYFGLEKNAPNGNNNMGVWFLQDGSVACDGTGVGGSGLGFTGNHTDGDIFLVAAFLNGGSNPEITAYRWQGGPGGALSAPIDSGGLCGASGSEDLCAITNDNAPVTTPWQTTNKGSSSPQNKTGQGTTLDADQFYEGAIDLTANGLDVDSEGNPICVNRFVFNTRASQETTATLYDYAAGDVETCFSPELDTLLYQETGATDTPLPPDGDHTVTLPVDVYDTSTLSGGASDPSGTITYSLWTDNTCETAATAPLFGNGTNVSNPVPVGDPSPTLTFTTAGNYWWQAEYTPSAGSRNEAAESDCATEPLVVEKQSPEIATTPSDTEIVIGGTPPASFSDTATITGGFFPASGTPAPGTVTFELYGPFSSAPGADDCVAGKKVDDSTNDATRVDNSSATATSDSYTPTAVGIYQWIAKYNGNAQNDATEFSPCGDTSEQVTVKPATPSIATTMLLGDKVKVTGVNGAGSIAGTVTFTLHKSADCSGAAVATFPDVALSSGVAETSSTTEVEAGTYSWKVVFSPASGSNYTGATTTCDPAAEEQATFSYSGDSPIASE